MIKQVLFNEKVEVVVSEISDGNMRFFNNKNEAKIIKNQERLGNALNLTGEKIARIKTIYGDRKNFTDFDKITSQNLFKYAITNPEEKIPVSDGLITKYSNVGILLPLADCLGVVVFDEEHQALIYKFENKLLSEIAKEQLTEAGVLSENIIDHKVDTVDNDNLPSHSNGDKTRRFAIIAKQV